MIDPNAGVILRVAPDQFCPDDATVADKHTTILVTELFTLVLPQTSRMVENR